MRDLSFRLDKVSEAIFISCLIVFIQLCQPFVVMAGDPTQLFSEKTLNDIESGQFIDASRDSEQLLDFFPYDVQNVIDFHSKTLALSQLDFDAHLNRGIAEEALGRWEDAEKDYQWILDRKPNESSVLYNLGNVKGSQGEWSMAEVLFKQATLERPGFVMAKSSKILAEYQLGEFDELESELRMLIRQYPMFADARAALTAFLWHQGCYGEAESHWAAVIGLDARYKDQDWLLNTRRWPPTPTKDLMKFLNLKSL